MRFLSRLERSGLTASVALAVGFTVAVACSSVASAQTTTAATTTASASTSLDVPINGTVQGATELVSFSGTAHVNTLVSTDPTTPDAVVSVDLRDLSGVGQSSLKKYVNTGQANLERVFGASDAIALTFAFFPAPAPSLVSTTSSVSTSSTRTGLASFTLSYDTTTGQLTGATGSITTPSF